MLSGVGTLSCSGRGSLSLSLSPPVKRYGEKKSYSEPDECITKDVHMFPSYKYVCSIVTTGC